MKECYYVSLYVIINTLWWFILSSVWCLEKKIFPFGVRMSFFKFQCASHSWKNWITYMSRNFSASLSERFMYASHTQSLLFNWGWTEFEKCAKAMIFHSIYSPCENLLLNNAFKQISLIPGWSFMDTDNLFWSRKQKAENYCGVETFSNSFIFFA